MSTRLLLTGANGYLGARCLKRWRNDTELEILAVRYLNANRELTDIPKHIRYATCDLSDAVAVEELCRRWAPQVIIHAAAALPDGQQGYLGRAIRANVNATENLATSGASFGCEQFLYCSSISVYGTPSVSADGWEESEPVIPCSEYGWTKFAGEEVLRVMPRSSMCSWSLRLAGMHGPGRKSGAVYKFIKAVLQGQPATVSPSAHRFQFAFVDDIVDLLRQAISWKSTSTVNVMNVATVTKPNLADLAKEIAELLGVQQRLNYGVSESNRESFMNLKRLEAQWRPTVDRRSRLFELINWVRSSC